MLATAAEDDDHPGANACGTSVGRKLDDEDEDSGTHIAPAGAGGGVDDEDDGLENEL